MCVQVGFITFLVLPLFKALANYSPALAPLKEQLERNAVGSWLGFRARIRDRIRTRARVRARVSLWLGA